MSVYSISCWYVNWSVHEYFIADVSYASVGYSLPQPHHVCEIESLVPAIEDGAHLLYCV